MNVQNKSDTLEDILEQTDRSKTIQTSEEIIDFDIPIHTLIIKQPKMFDSLFKGFSKLRTVSYVVSPEVLLDFFDKGYEKIEVVIGDNLTDSYRQHLSQKPLEVTKELEKLIAEGKLSIFSSRRKIHTKLYILENDEKIRAIQSSANFTETARRARQINYCWYIDFPFHTKQLEQIIVDYESHKENCTLFMGDLVELMKKSEDADKDRIIEVWLQSTVKSEEAETRKILHEATEKALGLDGTDEGSPMISISLDSSLGSQKFIKKVLNTFNFQETDKSVLLERANYLNHEKHGIPLMRVDLEKGKVVIGLNGDVITRTEEPINKASVHKSLKHLEDYIQTVELGEAPNPLATKMYLYEALLYVFTAPFFNEYMKMKRKKVGLIDLRGPRFVYIYGHSHNGKTTFLRFANQLLTGHSILPISGSELNRNRIMNAATVGTSFPLIFDDVPQSKWRKGCNMEEVFKNYWETQWNEKIIFPQIILSSNEYNLPKWAQSRIKRLEFDVLFTNNMENQKMLSNLISQDNPIFKWFSYIYIKHLKEGNIDTEDELYLSRKVMKELYAFAERQLPEFFTNMPVEKIYDAGKTKWRNLIYRYQKATLKNEKDAAYVDFELDMKYDIKEYLSCLPQNIKYVRKGTLVVIENPKDFHQWLKIDKESLSFLKRITRAIRHKPKSERETGKP